MKETFPISAANPAGQEAGRSVPTPVRFQIRPVVWGDRRRYEVVDTRTNATLVVRASRAGADDDVLVLNMGGTGGPLVSGTPVPEAEELVGTRRCGRCRGSFPARVVGEPAGPQDRWLCERCRRTLVGRPTGPASEDAGVSWPGEPVVPAL